MLAQLVQKEEITVQTLNGHEEEGRQVQIATVWGSYATANKTAKPRMTPQELVVSAREKGNAMT